MDKAQCAHRVCRMGTVLARLCPRDLEGFGQSGRMGMAYLTLGLPPKVGQAHSMNTGFGGLSVYLQGSAKLTGFSARHS
jgi:hypothetical protein